MSDNFTVDNHTIASNPGNANLNPFVWFLYNYKLIALMTLGLLLFIYLAAKISLWFIITSIILFGINTFYWLRKKEHFHSGDSNGGILISINPNLVAVSTDLTKGFGDFPVIKIITYKTSKKLKLGDRIPTVALYSESTDDNVPHWIDFTPIPLSYATNDKNVIQEGIDSYSTDEWNDLETRLKEVPRPDKKKAFLKSKLIIAIGKLTPVISKCMLRLGYKFPK